MIGQWVAFQTAHGALDEGEVIDYAPYTGIVLCEMTMKMFGPGLKST